MSSAIEDLWPAIEAPGSLPPLAVLRQQASLLGPKTQNLVQARVTTETSGPNLVHTFSIVAPALDYYSYALFNAVHRATALFPVQFQDVAKHAEEAVSGEGVHESRGGALVAHDEEGLRRILGLILSSEHTKRVISALVAQSQAAAD
jgi:hypothetical protein